MSWSQLLLTAFFLYLIILARYFLIAGFFYWALWKRQPPHVKKLQENNPSKKLIRAEIGWSVLTSIIFAIPGALMLEAWKAGHTAIYTQWSAWDFLYIPLSLFVYLFIHDTYYYWLHRWMHKPKYYRVLHEVHHQSTNPTPWASFSFHPYESILASLLIPALAFVIPIHGGALLFLLVLMTITSVINHTGYELLPERWVDRPILGSWLITSTHHNLHHTKFRCNYGLYFRWWDKWMKTDVMPAPAQEFESSARRKPQAAIPANSKA